MPSFQDTSSAAYKKAQRQHQKTTKNRNNAVDVDWTPFRAAEKMYKARFPPPSLANVLDLATLDNTRSEELEAGFWVGRSEAVEFREIKLKDARVAYAIPSIPGLVILPSFLSHKRQKDLIRWSLSSQARHPNPTNLDTHYFIPEEGLWNVSAHEDVIVQPRNPDPSSMPHETCTGPRQLINNAPASTDNFQTMVEMPKPPPTPSATAQPLPCSHLLRKMRWANIGWYYHWGTKQYDFAKGKARVDDVLSDVCKEAVRIIDWDKIYNTWDGLDWGDEQLSWKSWNENYEPDAGIVNFYQTKDTLMAHVDRSEVCATAPLVSISLGNAAVFLIGGPTRDTEPVPILLRSGDVVIMSGPACRRAYHGVPRILDDTLPPHLADCGDEDWARYASYMSKTRININVRQVFPRDFVPAILL
ncbi:uncharacterized protein BT62DRAFT_958504 [Guyanagaster necrorhizus]|uniref:Fe2OG dioxygenase domain-containing protein n=1 Tax=Guyanagaster necrorhizus TaxID=856835 RepID=A0A9P8B022_9AGAR|nr:uncharacterized protein BT62DRAFT_958504 [Guyanagaster necrorhizus MCA 3950]KAG7452572.1 hypothetical protein BT62DRAFT_958504 [Guyanagaster necrorhizus MCA 3950]